jgi:hypothetical protein
MDSKLITPNNVNGQKHTKLPGTENGLATAKNKQTQPF